MGFTTFFGSVFTAIGFVAIVILILAITWAPRRFVDRHSEVEKQGDRPY